MITVDPQFIMFICWLSVCASINLNPHSLLASVNSWVGRLGLYGFNCRFCVILCLICLNSELSSSVQVPSQWLFSCVISLRCFVCSVSVGYQLCNTLTIPRKDWTCVLVVGGSMLTMVLILAGSAVIVMLLFCSYVRLNPP